MLKMRRIWIWLFSGLVGIPGLFLLASWSELDQELWQHLLDTQLSRLALHSLVLALGVGALVLVFGTWAAWCVVRYQFPGRRLLQWLLVLPLAFPPYVLAFVYSGWLSYPGPVRSWIRDLGVSDAAWLDASKPWMVCLILSLGLFPYVYLVARTAFMAQTLACKEAAQSMGASEQQVFWRIQLPMARPAIIAGLSLALMEALGDFGAVSILGFDTFTTAIYKSWFSFFSLQTAAQLSTLLLSVLLILILFEKTARGRSVYHVSGRKIPRVQPSSKIKSLAMTLSLSVLLASALFIPLGQLLVWAIKSAEPIFKLGELSLNTARLALSGAGCVVALAGLLLWAERHSNTAGRFWGVELATIGYALPGTVLAVAVLLSATAVGRWFGLDATALTMAGLSALLLAYCIRFLRVAFSPIHAAMLQLKPSMLEAARSLGAGPGLRFYRIVLPLLRPGIGVAVLMCVVEIMKELPMTLMLRPFGQDTLATKIYELSSEGEWERAALPALVLVAIGAFPALWLMRDRK